MNLLKRSRGNWTLFAKRLSRTWLGLRSSKRAHRRSFRSKCRKMRKDLPSYSWFALNTSEIGFLFEGALNEIEKFHHVVGNRRFRVRFVCRYCTGAGR